MDRKWHTARLAPLKEKAAKFWNIIGKQPLTDRNPLVKNGRFCVRASDWHASAVCMLWENDFETKLFALEQLGRFDLVLGYPSKYFFVEVIKGCFHESETDDELTTKIRAVISVMQNILEGCNKG